MKITIISTILFVATTLMSFTPTAPNADMPITLPLGTAISLELNEEVNGNEVEIGNAVEFLVRSNVTINGQVVIAAGSIAEGMVKKVTKSCHTCKRGGCAAMTIVVETVQAVDGQHIYVRSKPLNVKANCCCGENEPAIAHIGRKVSVVVQNNVRINA